jgi:hypothetical protein
MRQIDVPASYCQQSIGDVLEDTYLINGILKLCKSICHAVFVAYPGVDVW